MRLRVLCISVLLSIFPIIKTENPTPPKIKIKNGELQGVRKPILDRFVDVYYGIPYAKPPVGDLKFKKPQAAEPWTGTLEANKKPNSCIQSPITYLWGTDDFPKELNELFNPDTPLSEDCLYLNVWTPALRDPELKLLNVLVWIHGGGFVQGSSTLDFYDGSYLSAYKDFVFVSMNYRLGPAGFLYLGTEDAPGNMALYDQGLALDWVKENIKFFGGNPDSVTIFGESAGGASVSAHVLSPVTRDKFHKALMQSGSANAPWGTIKSETALEKAEKLAELVGCKDEISDKSKLAECFRKVSPEELDKTAYNVSGAALDIGFVPTVDGHFFPKSPAEMLLEGDFKKNAKLIIGNTAQEFSFILPIIFPKHFKMNGDISLSKADVDGMIKKMYEKMPQQIQDLIKLVYTDYNDPENVTTIRDNFVNLFGDSFFVCAANSFAAAVANKSIDIYYYQYAHASEYRYFDQWVGAYHGEEVGYFYGAPFTNTKNFTEDERNLSNRMMNNLVNFAKTGDPMVDKSWVKYSANNPSYHEFTVNGPNKMSKGPRGNACEFWNSILPKMIQRSAGTNSTKAQ